MDYLDFRGKDYIKWERNNLHIQKKGDIKGLNIEVTPTTIQSDHQPFFVLLS